jgi:hypothetical protein
LKYEAESGSSKETANVSRDSGACPAIEEQISQAKKEKISNNPDEVAAIDACGHQMSQGNGENTPRERFEFELQYGLSSTTFRGILEEILRDVRTNYIHNWDENLNKGPLKDIIRDVYMSWRLDSCTEASLIAHSTVEEILGNAANTSTPSIEEAGDVGSYLFFTKVGNNPCRKFLCLMLIHLKRNPNRLGKPLVTLQEISQYSKMKTGP